MFLLHFLTKILGKILRSTKKFRGECPPWLQAWFRFSGYLTKPTIFDETK